MPTICIANSKGGTGKSTIACMLAGCFASYGSDVMLAVTDEQTTSPDWAAFRTRHEQLPGVATADLSSTQLRLARSNLSDFDAKYDVVIVDTGGFDVPSSRAAIIAAHLIITPLAPTYPDIAEVRRFLKIIDDAISYKEQERWAHAFLLNRVTTHARGQQLATRAALENLEAHQAQSFDTVVHRRQIYADLMQDGRIPQEITQRTQNAYDEVEALFREVKDVLDQLRS